MTRTRVDPSERMVGWWVKRYTAGLPFEDSMARRWEIESDLAEHQRARDLDGWSGTEIRRERTTRLIRGIPSDLGWRHDLIRPRANPVLRWSIIPLTSLASVLLAMYLLAFAIYMLGETSLSDRRFLGGLHSYADEVGRPVASTVAASIMVSVAVILIAMIIARPISPLMANVVTIVIALVPVMWFWLGIWPVGLVAIAGSTIDLVARANPEPARPPVGTG